MMSEKRFVKDHSYLVNYDKFCILDKVQHKHLYLDEVCEKLNEQQFIIEELKTHNLQHFLEWLVIKGYVTDEPMKDINNVIDCVNKFNEYLTELDKFKEWLGVLEDE